VCHSISVPSVALTGEGKIIQCFRFSPLPNPSLSNATASQSHEPRSGVIEYAQETPTKAPELLRGISEDTLASAIVDADSLDDLQLPVREFLCGTWLRQGDLGFIYAERGLGKTWLALHLARNLAEGSNVGPWKVSKRRRVLIVDGEMPLDGVKERNASLRNGEAALFILNHEWLFQKTGCVLNLSHAVAQAAVFRLCVGRALDLVVLDNFRTAECKIRDHP
jgi:hypothetical protein